jgi:hypothetical protein
MDGGLLQIEIRNRKIFKKTKGATMVTPSSRHRFRKRQR